MLSCPREILAQIARDPAEMRSLHRTCRTIAAHTRGLFHRSQAASENTKANWSTLEISGAYTSHTFEFDTTGRTMWTFGGDFDGDVTPFTLVPEVPIWDYSATIDNLIFAVAGACVVVGLTADCDTAEQFVGTYIDQVYRVIGFYNNFRGVNYTDTPGPGKNVFATLDGGKWTICTTDTPLHLIRGTVLALESTRD